MDTTKDCPFAINYEGQVFLSNDRDFDYEVMSQWVIGIRVYDKYGLFDETFRTINLIDINEAPSFTRSLVHREGSYPIRMDDPVGIPVTAIDPDGDSLSYAISLNEYFIIDDYGQIRVSNISLDPWLSYNLTVTAIDPDGLFDQTVVTISFRTNSSSSFSVINAFYSVPENVSVGVALLPAISVVGVYSSPLNFELISNSTSSPFQIDSESGVISVSQHLDFERVDFYSYQIVVTDFYGQQRVASVSITVVDVNEPPIVDSYSCSVVRSVLETKPENTFLYPFVIAVDPDENDRISFSIEKLSFDTEELPFDINEFGILYIRNGSQISFKRRQSYSFMVYATDTAGNEDSCLLHVAIQKENTAPIIQWIQEEVFIPEDTPVGSTIMLPMYVETDDEYDLTYTFRDITTSRNRSYSFPFRSSSTSSNLVLKSTLNYERQTQYTVRFCAIDYAELSACHDISLVVTDVNEPPTFVNPPSTVHVSEAAPIGYLISRISATDPESGVIFYSLSGGMNFDIHRQSGEITIVHSVDFETQSNFTLLITAMDELGLSSSISLNVLVDDVNEPPTCAYTSVTISENVAVGSVIAHMNASDPEVQSGLQTLQFSLLADGNDFGIDNEGDVRVLQPLNYWRRSTYIISVQITDNGDPSLSTSCALVIQLTDINTPPILHINQTVVYVPEDTPMLVPISLHAWIEDEDIGQKHTFFVNENDVFGINPVTGDIFLKSSLDYETENLYTLSIGVIDDSLDSLSDAMNITVVVLDVNEPPTLLTEQIIVPENTVVGSIIGFIRYHDEDQGVNGTVRCILNSLSSVVSVNETSCFVYLQHAVDYETVSEYSISISLVDGGNLTTSGIVQITVSDVNEPPMIQLSSNTTSIPIDAEIGTDLPISIIVTDPEDDSVVTIIRSTMDLPFVLNEVGVNRYSLRVNSSLANIEKIVSIEIVASDASGLIATAFLNVTLNAANTLVPIIPSVHCYIEENATLSTIIPNCEIQVVNAGDFENITYSQQFNLASSAFHLFSINETAIGVLVVEELDYEVMKEYVIPFTVTTERFENEVSANGVVFIHILDVNEAPIFTVPSSTLFLPENTAKDTIVHPCLHAYDPDESDDNITYAIVEENLWIGIHNETGCLYVKQDGLDFENDSQLHYFQLVVSASDSHGLASYHLVTVNVTNVNEPPSFAASNYYFTSTTPVRLNTTIGYEIPVSDPDQNAILSFSILQQTCPNGFTVDSDRALISSSAISIPEFHPSLSERNRTCVLVLQVADEFGLTDSTIVHITLVSNIEEPVILTHSMSIEENPVQDQFIGAIDVQSRCDIANNDSFSFLLLPSPYSNLVSIPEDSNRILVKNLSFFDYEMLPSFNIYVMAIETSCYNVSSTQEISISLLDVNEAPIVESASFHLYPTTTYPALLKPPIAATDPEGTELHFDFVSAHPNVTVDGNGFITVWGDLAWDEEAQAPSLSSYTYEFNLTVSDSALPPLSSSFSVVLQVDKIHLPNIMTDDAPVFTNGHNITISVAEDTLVGEKVEHGLVVSTGSTQNPILFYSITSCIPLCPVIINSVNGDLMLSSALDFESISEYMINVTVTNGVKTDYSIVTLLVEDVDDCVIHSITPNQLLFTSTSVVFSGANLSPSYTFMNSSAALDDDQSISIDYNLTYTIFNQSSILLSDYSANCSVIESENHVQCTIPQLLGSRIQFSLSWKSSTSRAILHTCSVISSNEIYFEPIQVDSIHSISPIPTNGTTVCITGSQNGSSLPIASLLEMNAINVSRILMNQQKQGMTNCEESGMNQICCETGSGFGSSISIELCVFDSCSISEYTSFEAPSITSVTATDELSCAGGDNIIIQGNNLGNDLSVLHIFVRQDQENKELQNCTFVIPHESVSCSSIAGYGTSLLFTVIVGDQQASFQSSTAYKSPMISDVYGAGAVNALTSGNQVIFVSGNNLGMKENSSYLIYGNATSLSLVTSPCSIIIPHSLLRCISSVGSGHQDRWMIVSGTQESPLFVQPNGIYGSPIVHTVEEQNEFLPLSGGMNITICGLNFGNDSSLLSVQYENENGVFYYPECVLLLNHTKIRCISVAGYGNAVVWSITVNGLTLNNAFKMMYTPPLIYSLSCKFENCGNTAGGDVVVLTGENFGNFSSSLRAMYGYSGIEYTTSDCFVTSTTQIECITAPGVGQSLSWNVYMDNKKIGATSTLLYSYQQTQITYEGSAISVKGGDQILLTVSNNFTYLLTATFKVLFNSITVNAQVNNATTLLFYSPSLQSIGPSVSISVIISDHMHTAETTNQIEIPIQNPVIDSYRIETVSLNGTTMYHISLHGSNFGYAKNDVMVAIQTDSQSEESSLCAVQTIVDDLVTCRSTISEGEMILARGSQTSNSIVFLLNEAVFDSDDYEVSENGYIVYPQSFSTQGGQILSIRGWNIPEQIIVTIGSSICSLSHHNATDVLCIVPPGEGRFVPVLVRQNQQVLFQFYLAYQSPSILSISPSTLRFDSINITIEGTNFGLHPLVEISGVSTGLISCSILSHSHQWIQCSLAEVDPVGMVLQVVSAYQTSNSIVLQIASPTLFSLQIEDSNGRPLDGIPVSGDAVVHLVGENLNAANALCLMNNEQLVVLFNNGTDMYCNITESFATQAKFSVLSGRVLTNILTADFQEPDIHSISPLFGKTAGGDIIHIEGRNFGCSSEMGIYNVHILFGGQLLPDNSIISCNAYQIEFRSPSGQGTNIEVQVTRQIQSAQRTSLFRFDYLAPELFTFDVIALSDEDSSNSVAPMEQNLFILEGENFGNEPDGVWISDRKCLIIQHNHTSIHCLSPLFIGGNHSLFVQVVGQKSNVMWYQFPSPSILSISPLVMESMNSSLLLHGLNLPPISGVPISLMIGEYNITNCHIALSSTDYQRYVECHLPELPRGVWSIQMTINSEYVSIPAEYNQIVIICPAKYYAADGSFCQVCPEDTICEQNTTLPIAPVGQWVASAFGTPIVSKCYNSKACLGNNKCAIGYKSEKCSECEKGYSRYNTWTCTKCPSGIGKVFPILKWVLVVVALYAASLSRYSTYFIWFALLMDTLQLLGLFSMYASSFSNTLAPILNFCSMLVLDMDAFHLDCYFSSISPLEIWVFALISIFAIFGLDIIVRCILKTNWNLQFPGGFVVQFTNLLYVSFCPLLYHALQSLSCDNKYFNAAHSSLFTNMTMCYKNSDYTWILVVSIILFLFVMLGTLHSFVLTARGKVSSDINRSEKLSKNSLKEVILEKYQIRQAALGLFFNNHSYLCFYYSFLFKLIVTISLVLFRTETQFQSVTFFALIVSSIVFVYHYAPYQCTHQHLQLMMPRTLVASSSENNEEKARKKQEEADICVIISSSEKKLWFDPNKLQIQGLAVFLLFFIAVVITPRNSFLSHWRSAIDVCILLVFTIYILCEIAAGAGEICYILKQYPIAWLEMLRSDFHHKNAESVYMHNEETKVNSMQTRERSRSTLEEHLYDDMSAPTISFRKNEEITKISQNVFQSSVAELIMTSDYPNIESEEIIEDSKSDVVDFSLHQQIFTNTDTQLYSEEIKKEKRYSQNIYSDINIDSCV